MSVLMQGHVTVKINRGVDSNSCTATKYVPSVLSLSSFPNAIRFISNTVPPGIQTTTAAGNSTQQNYVEQQKRAAVLTVLLQNTLHHILFMRFLLILFYTAVQ